MLLDRPLAVDARPGDRGRDRRRSLVRRHEAGRDRIAVVAVGKQAVQLTELLVDDGRGGRRAPHASRSTRSAAPRSTTQSCSRRRRSRADVNPTRILVLLTDGQEVSSDASPRAGDRRRRATRTSPSTRSGSRARASRPAPLQRLAAEDRRPLRGAAGTNSLHAIYAALAQELRRTWQLSLLHARPGPATGSRSQAGGRDRQSRRARRARPRRPPTASKLPEPFFKIGPMLHRDHRRLPAPDRARSS